MEGRVSVHMGVWVSSVSSVLAFLATIVPHRRASTLYSNMETLILNDLGK